MLKEKKKKSRIPFRLNILFFIIFLSFSVLVIQLGIVQILEGETFQTEIDRTVEDISKIPVPRGKIYDRNHQLVVDNKAMYSITYTPPKRVQPMDKLKLAQKLVHYMKMDEDDVDRITERNKKEYWYLMNKEEAVNRLTEKEKEELDDIEQYDLALERITDEDIGDLTEEELQVIAIKRELDKAYALTPQVIKNSNISPEEYAKIAENLSELPGINASTDWERQLVTGEALQSIIGSITTQEQGIPLEKMEYFLSRGYNRNDRVGKSGLEQQYEEVLRGRKEQVKFTTTKEGEVIDSDIIVPGERGKDLVLTIDMDFQEKVDKIVLDELKKARGKSYHNRFAVDALAVVINPKTGEILALSGQHYNEKEDKYESEPFKTIYDAHRPGSVIKGATILAGLNSGAISPGQTFYDRPIKIYETPTKGSWTSGIGSVNDINAIKASSNVYMFYVALRMIGEYRYPFPDNATATFNRAGVQELRNNFQQFGLGVNTGLDFPSEGTGYVGKDPNPGLMMDFAIGQYDTYTTLQLAQYVSTIANDGYRVQPKLVKEIRYPSVDETLGAIYQYNETNILNEIEANNDYIKRVQEGFWKVFNERGGTGYHQWANKSYRPAGKTGTAENEIFEDGKLIANTENLSLVGYAPFEDPEIAFAVIVPNLGNIKGQYSVNHMIGKRIMDAYFLNNDGEIDDEEEDE